MLAALLSILIAASSASAPPSRSHMERPIPEPVQPGRPAAPARLDAVARDTLRAAIEKDRKDTQDWLRQQPTSYLATIDRKDFGSATSLTVGRAGDNDVRLEDPAVSAHHLRVTVVGDSFRVEAVDPGAGFKYRDHGKDVESRSAHLPPSAVGVARYSIRLSHQRYPALIVFDPESPRYKLYHGLKYFPVNFAYRYELPLTPNPRPDTLVIMSTRGNQRRAVRVGWLDFKAGGKACRLEATRLLEPGVGEKDFGVFFRDATTGRESYKLGRYVDVQPTHDGLYLMDFNNAYNPACAFSDHYNCPIPPRDNTLKVAIRAGEMDSHYH